MPGYVIFNIEIKKTEEYKEYVEKVTPIAKKFGGEYLSLIHISEPTRP